MEGVGCARYPTLRRDAKCVGDMQNRQGEMKTEKKREKKGGREEGVMQVEVRGVEPSSFFDPVFNETVIGCIRLLFASDASKTIFF